MNFVCGTYFKHQCGLQLTDYKNARDSVFVNFKIMAKSQKIN